MHQIYKIVLNFLSRKKPVPSMDECSIPVMTLQFCQSRLAPESSLFNLDSRFRGNDGSKIIVKKC